MQKELNYLYISGSIRVLETKLMNAEVYGKLINAASSSEILKIAESHGYDVSGIDAADAHFADSLVAKQRKALFAMLKKDAPNSEFFNFFLYPDDYLNLKVLIKNSIKETPTAKLSEAGSVPVNQLKRAVDGLEAKGLTAHMTQGIEKAKKCYAETLDPQTVDIVLDGACFADMAEAAEKSGEEFLRGYVRLLIDIANVKAYFRMKKMGKNAAFAQSVFAQGGSLPAEFYCKEFGKKIEEFEADVHGTPIEGLVKKAISYIEQFGGRGMMEQSFDGVIMDYAKTAKYIPYGAPVIAAYIIAKETEFKNIRIICAARAAGVKPAEIKERLRVPYV